MGVWAGNSQKELHMNVGDKVPDFEAIDQTGATVTLSSLLEDGPLVLFFYPKAMTPG